MKAIRKKMMRWKFFVWMVHLKMELLLQFRWESLRSLYFITVTYFLARERHFLCISGAAKLHQSQKNSPTCWLQFHANVLMCTRMLLQRPIRSHKIQGVTRSFWRWNYDEAHHPRRSQSFRCWVRSRLSNNSIPPNSMFFKNSKWFSNRFANQS